MSIIKQNTFDDRYNQFLADLAMARPSDTQVSTYVKIFIQKERIIAWQAGKDGQSL
jgi:hypothetical protein